MKAYLMILENTAGSITLGMLLFHTHILANRKSLEALNMHAYIEIYIGLLATGALICFSITILYNCLRVVDWWSFSFKTLHFFVSQHPLLQLIIVQYLFMAVVQYQWEFETNFLHDWAKMECIYTQGTLQGWDIIVKGKNSYLMWHTLKSIIHCNMRL